MAETFAQLEAEYCPPIDPPLLSAILSDFDLANEKDVESARNTLDSLKESADLEEAAGFDASATGGLAQDVDSEERAESWPGTSASQSKETDVSNLSDPLSSMDLEDDYARITTSNGGAEDIDKLDNNTKIQLLQELFGKHFSLYSIEYTLRNCDGKWSAAMDELLNHVYFGESTNGDDGERFSAKGIDGFSEDNIIRRGRRGKGKSKTFNIVDERRTSSLPGLRNEDSAPAPNRWKAAATEIEFVASRTGIPATTVSSVYYETGASLPSTIAALIKVSSEESKPVVKDGLTVSSQAQELSQHFPTITLEDLNVIVRLTHPSTVFARDLATALTVTPSTPTGAIHIIPRYSRFHDLDTESSNGTTVGKAKSAASSRSSSSDGLSAAARRDAYNLARTVALSQANAARRKAKSDHLMGGAAAHYSQVSREYAELSLGASARASDQLAASQSTSTKLDLHGIDVRNAVRIAQEKVEEWWHGLGESRVNGRVGAEERQSGYNIVVGLGRHSEGGHSKLGPAVTKMLRQEGWRIEPAGGIIVVKGRVKK